MHFSRGSGPLGPRYHAFSHVFWRSLLQPPKDDLRAGGGNTLSQDSMIRRLAMAHAFTMTQNGAPLLYYGDEIGLALDCGPGLMPSDLLRLASRPKRPCHL